MRGYGRMSHFWAADFDFQALSDEIKIRIRITIMAWKRGEMLAYQFEIRLAPATFYVAPRNNNGSLFAWSKSSRRKNGQTA
jgi:hypothetical protein